VNHLEKKYEYELKLADRRIQSGFFGTMRAVLDSKFGEIVLKGLNYKEISRFPDFLFSFLMRFAMDRETRKVRLLNEFEQGQ